MSHKPGKGLLRIFLIFLSSLLFLGLWGCGKADQASKKGDTPVSLTWGDYVFSSPAGQGFEIKDNVLVFTGNNSQKLRWVRLTTAIYDNFQLQVSIRKLSGSLDNLCGVMVRAVESFDAQGFPTEGYAAGLEQQGYITFFKREGSKSVPLKDWQYTASLHEGNGINRLKILAEGPQLSFYVNDILVNAQNDLSFQTGLIYLVYYDGSPGDLVEFLDFELLPSTAINIPPTVSFQAPGAGAVVSGENVSLAASASDSDGSVVKVEFYIGSELLSTDLTSPYTAVWNTKNYANQNYNLVVKAYDNKGAVSQDNRVVTVNNPVIEEPVVVTFGSIPAEDGYIKANSDGSSAAVGSLTTLALGRGMDGLHSRSVLSFDTSSLPDGATITKATLEVSFSSLSGSPWASGNQLVVDVKEGSFGGSATETGDWAAAPDEPAVALIEQFNSGTKASTLFEARGLLRINRTGKTQLKLRFANFHSATNYLFIKQGADARLSVEYLP